MAHLQSPVTQYALVTLNYWVFTITDGALRMLVVLYFHTLGYTPLAIAFLFIFYEFFGIVTNLFGGFIATRIGLNRTMQIGALLQIVALGLLLVDSTYLSAAYVMVAQALSGIAKDLNKMSAKSSIKLLVKSDANQQLYRWVALLTGSKNALKGVGFFIGALLLASLDFRGAIAVLLLLLLAVFIPCLWLLTNNLGKTEYKAKFNDLLSKSTEVNRLSAARFFLFGARDIWFVIALPVFLQSELQWSHSAVGSLLAVWIIGYGIVQSIAPMITHTQTPSAPAGRSAYYWALALSIIPLLLVATLQTTLPNNYCIVIGLFIFGAVFAVNSSLHSYLIIAYAQKAGVSLDVGFYYMSNAAGRLAGTLLSGLVYQQWGFSACLIISSLLLGASAYIAAKLPAHSNSTAL